MDRRKTDRRIDNRQDIHMPDISDILHILGKRKLLILSFILIPALCTLVVLKFKPDKFKATATVMLENQKLNLANFQDVSPEIKFDNLTVPTQINVIQSPNLIRDTIRKLGIREDENGNIAALSEHPSEPAAADAPVGYGVLKHFTENLEIKQQGASRIIEISFISKDPDVAAQIANAHAEQYVLSQVQVKKKQAETLHKWLSEQIIQLKEENLRKSNAVQRFRVESGMVLGLNSQELVYQQISNIAAQLSPIEARMLDLQARSEVLKKGNAQSITEVVESKLIQDLKSRSSIASQKLESLRTDYGDNHPEVIATKKEIEQINGDIGQEIKNVRKSIENELITVSKQNDLLTQKLSELQKQADSFQEKQITLQALQLEEAASRKLLDSFLARSEEINSQIDFSRPDVTIVSPADIPGEPMGSKKTIIVLAVIVLSTLAALGVVFLLEISDNGIEKKDDVRKLLNAKLLGTLPKENMPITRVLEKERSAYLEEIKRISIHLSAQPETKTILLTSARRGEGKSSVAMSLAYYLTSIGKKTIIIDADTMNPVIAGITGIPASPGLYEILAGTCPLKDAITRDKMGLYVLPSGEQNAYISDLLMAGKFQPYLSALEKAYDYVLIDCAPALEVSDAEIFSRLVDQTVLVTLWAKTPRRKLKEAIDYLRPFSKSVPNVVLNKMNLNEM